MQIMDRALADINSKKPKGELFCWIAAFYIDNFVNGYLAYNDTAWLDTGIKYYDWALSKREKTHDDYLGWIGPYGGQEGGLIGEAFIGDAVIFNEILRFCEVVNNSPELKSKYGKKAEEYMADARKQLIDKWDKRGCYYEDGGFAVYIKQTTWWDDKSKKWIEREKERGTENLNKHAKMATCFLKFYRITKEKMFFDRAEKIFGHYKQIMRWHKNEDRYIWNFWEPFGPFDMTSKPKGWVDVHTQRPGYQAAESAMMAEAYHTGCVFNETDMRRIVNTNLWMWNKSFDNPKFKSADGETNAGTLWKALSDFDATIRQLTEKTLKDSGDVVEYDYFKKVVCKEPPSYKRKYVTGNVNLPEINLYPNTDISMAVVIPATLSLKANEKIKLCCKVKATGKLIVDLYTSDGKTLIKNLFKEDIKKANDFYTQKWDGTGTSKGNYRIRWTLNNSISDRPLKIVD